MEDTIIAQGWVVKRNRTGILGGQAWRYLLIRARRKEGSPVELKGFYADDPDAASARMVFDWADAPKLCFTLSDSSMTPSSLAAAAEIPLHDLGAKAPHSYPRDLQWLVLTTDYSGAFSSFAFGAELQRMVFLAKRLAEHGVPLGRLQVGGAATDPPHAPATAPSLFAGEDGVPGGWRAPERSDHAFPLTGYCEKRGGGTSLFGSEAFKRRFIVIQRAECAGQGG
jgi:hypothetical protein